MTVTKSIFGQETKKEKTISVQAFEVDPAYVSWKNGLTLNMGNYESARLDLSVMVPCYTEEIPVVVRKLKKFVDAEIGKEAEQMGIDPEIQQA